MHNFIKLTYSAPDTFTTFTRKIDFNELSLDNFQSGSLIILGDNNLGFAYIYIKKIDGMLEIRTKQNVDISLHGILPIKGAKIDTMGECAIKSAMSFSEGLAIAAKNININHIIHSMKYIMLCVKGVNNTINLKHDLRASTLVIIARNIVFNNTTSAIFTFFSSKSICLTDKAECYFNAHNLIFRKDALETISLDMRKEALSVLDYSLDGTFNTNVMIHTDIFSSHGSLEMHDGYIFSRDRISFEKNSESKFYNIYLEKSKKIDIVKGAKMNGSIVHLSDIQSLQIDGDVTFEDIKIFAHDCVVNGKFYANKTMQAKIEGMLSVYGVFGSLETIVWSKYLYASASGFNLEFFHGDHRRGGVIGIKNLEIHTVATLLVAGGYLYGSTIHGKTGFYGNFGGFVWSNIFVLNELLSFSEFGLELPWFAYDNKDYFNPIKLLKAMQYIFAELNPMVAKGTKLAESLYLIYQYLQYRNVNVKEITDGIAHAEQPVISDLIENGENKPLTKKMYDKIVAIINQCYVNIQNIISQTSMQDFVEYAIYLKECKTQFLNVTSHVSNALSFTNDLIRPIQTKQISTFSFNNIKDMVTNKATKFAEELFDSNLHKRLISNIIKDSTRELKNHILNKYNFITRQTKSDSYNPYRQISFNFSWKHLVNDVYEQIKMCIDECDLMLYNISGNKRSNDKLIPACNGESDKVWQELSLINTHQIDPYKSIYFNMLQKAFSLFGSTTTKFSLLKYNGSFSLNANDFDESWFCIDNGFKIAIESHVNSFYYINNGAVISKIRNERSYIRINHNSVNVSELNIKSTHNYEYADITANKLIYDVQNSYVGTNVNFSAKNDSEINASSTFVIDGSAELSGNVNIENLHVEKNGKVNIERAEGFVKHINAEGNVRINNSNVLNEKITFHDTTNFEIEESVFNTKDINLSSRGHLKVIKSLLNANNLKISEESLIESINSFIKAVNVENNGEWKFSGYLSIETQHIQSSEASSLIGDKDSYYDLQSATYACLGKEVLDAASKYIKNMPSQEALRLALSHGEYSKQQVKTFIEITTDDNGSVVFSGVRADGAHVIFNTGGIITLGPEFDRAKGVTFNNYNEALEFVHRYASYNIPEPKKKKGFLRKVCSVLEKVAGAVAVVCAGNPLISVPAVALCAAFNTAKNKMDKDQITKIENFKKDQANLNHDANQKIISIQEQQHLAQEIKNLHVKNANKTVDILNDPKSQFAKFNQPSLTSVDDIRNMVSASYDEMRYEEKEAHLKHLMEITEFYEKQRKLVDASSSVKIGAGIKTRANADGIDIGLTTTTGFNGQQGPSSYAPIWTKDKQRIEPVKQVEKQTPKPKIETQNKKSDKNNYESSKIKHQNIETKDAKIKQIDPNEHLIANEIDDQSHKYHFNSSSFFPDNKRENIYDRWFINEIERQNKLWQQEINCLEQQFEALIAQENVSYYQFKYKENNEKYSQIKEKYDRLLPEYERESNKYHNMKEKFESNKKDSIWKATALSEVASDLEETTGRKVFEKAKKLSDMQNEMKAYAEKDLSNQINELEDKVARNKHILLKQERQIQGKSSKVKDIIGAGAIEVANQYRQFDTAMNSMFKRHRDAMNIVNLASLAAAPLPTAAGMAVHSVLSTNFVSRQLYNVSDNILDYAGVDSTSRQDLNRLLVNQAKGVATGVVAGGVYHKFQTWKKFKEFKNSHHEEHTISESSKKVDNDALGKTFKNHDENSVKNNEKLDRTMNDPLRRSKHGEPAIDPEFKGKPHTQLGTKNGRKCDYTQAREFNADGYPVRDIDFTDHGRSNDHPNPHQHRYEPNSTGGTLQRSNKAEPLSENCNAKPGVKLDE